MRISLTMPETIIFHRILDRIIKDGIALGSQGFTERSKEEVRLAEQLRRELLKV